MGSRGPDRLRLDLDAPDLGRDCVLGPSVFEVLRDELRAARSDWECEVKRASPPSFAFQPDFTSVCLNDVLYNRQAETGSTRFTRARPVHSIETLENTRM